MNTIVHQVRDAVIAAQLAASTATREFLELNGNRDDCGFAWITVNEKGSTKVGRALLQYGFTKAYGGGLQLWNPSGSNTHAITAKEVGAEIAAEVLRKQLGVAVVVRSRLD